MKACVRLRMGFILGALLILFSGQTVVAREDQSSWLLGSCGGNGQRICGLTKDGKAQYECDSWLSPLFLVCIPCGGDGLDVCNAFYTDTPGCREWTQGLFIGCSTCGDDGGTACLSHSRTPGCKHSDTKFGDLLLGTILSPDTCDTAINKLAESMYSFKQKMGL